jgi:NAD(P)-dependent dehydrogenase (short-subunit alcohol dehydrogenase family)
MAKACGPDIRVNAVAPGLILTEWANGFSQEVITGWEKATALKRVPTPEDIAATYSEAEARAVVAGSGVAALIHYPSHARGEHVHHGE